MIVLGLREYSQSCSFFLSNLHTGLQRPLDFEFSIDHIPLPLLIASSASVPCSQCAHGCPYRAPALARLADPFSDLSLPCPSSSSLSTVCVPAGAATRTRFCLRFFIHSSHTAPLSSLFINTGLTHSPSTFIRSLLSSCLIAFRAQHRNCL